MTCRLHTQTSQRSLALTLSRVGGDDFKVTHTKSNVIQANEYYPYGLQTANSWTRENNTGNNFLYNGGTELNQTTQVYDLYYRNYDPVLGRFGQVDPMAGKYSSLSPYNYGNNNPVFYNDPLGDCPTCGCNVCDSPVAGSYVASGRGDATYRDMDPTGRYTTARIMAQSIERMSMMRDAQKYQRLIDSWDTSKGGHWENGDSYEEYAAEDHHPNEEETIPGPQGLKKGILARILAGIGKFFSSKPPTEDFPGGLMFTNVAEGLNTLWEMSFKNKRVHKENMAYFINGGLLILPNINNKRNRSSHSLPTEVIDGKVFVTHNSVQYQVLAIVHTHPDAGGIQEPSARADYTFQSYGIHNYVMSSWALWDAYQDTPHEMGKRTDYFKLPLEIRPKWRFDF